MTPSHIIIPTDRFHLVSKALLGRFCGGPRNMLMALNVNHPTSRPLERSPRSLGFSRNLEPELPHEFEDYWKPTEDKLPDALDAVEAGTVLSSEKHKATIRTAIALHWARSFYMMRVSKQTRDRALKDAEKRYEGFAGITSLEGIIPDGDEGRKAVAKQRIDRIANTQFRYEVVTAKRMVHNFRIMHSFLIGHPLKVFVAADDAGDFLIGDTPAHTLGENLEHDVPLFDSITTVLPVGRRHVVALNDEDIYDTADQDLVDFLNEIQVKTAESRVAWNPESALTAFVRTTLG